MKSLNFQSTQIFHAITSIAKQSPDYYVKIRNNESYMPLSVELINKIEAGEVWSLAHYGEQNGDLMADPMMDFLVTPSQFVYPICFRNDYAGIYDEAVYFEGGRLSKYCFSTYNSLRSFSEIWLRNIEQQQLLKVA